MIPGHVQAQPHQYNSSIKKIVNYFCKQKYSISYSSDIIMVMNMWAKHYAKHKGVYADLIEKMAPAYREAIKEAHDTKEESVRKRALPITRAEIENMLSQVIKSNSEEMSYCRWVVASWLFGLRPSELDRFILGDQDEDRVSYENGVKCIVVKQTKTVNKTGVRLSYKKIPILSKEQDEALEAILNKPTRRPHPDWMDKKLKIKGKKYRPEGHKFDCYSGRKGFIDLMLSSEYNQKLENISVYLGHSSVTTSYVHYKDKENLHYTSTPYTEKSKKPMLAG
jgi:integrase